MSPPLDDLHKLHRCNEDARAEAQVARVSDVMPVIPQKPISPEGGESERLTIRLPRGCEARIDEVARQRGVTRSEYVRTALLALLDAEAPQEVTTQAS